MGTVGEWVGQAATTVANQAHAKLLLGRQDMEIRQAMTGSAPRNRASLTTCEAGTTGSWRSSGILAPQPESETRSSMVRELSSSRRTRERRVAP